MTFDSRSHWSDRAQAYRDTMQSGYHRNRLAMIDALLREGDLRGRVLDFGCGDGAFAERTARAGGTVHCIDIDPSMVAATAARLSDCPAGNYQVSQGGLDALEDVPLDSIDTLLALNVLAYLLPAEAAAFYRHVQRMLRPGGVLIVTHSNELFDLFTLNRYTVAFFKRHFSIDASLDGVGALLTHPDEPQRLVFPTRENPLRYRYALARFDLVEEQQEFAILHPQPPLLMSGFDPDDLATRECLDTIGWPEEERWKLMFMCSVFGSRAIRQGRQ